VEILKEIKVSISQKDVLRLQGYKEKDEARSDVKDILAKQIQEGYRLIKPKAVYTILSVLGIEGNLIKLEAGLILNSERAAKVWKGSEYLGIAICTIGPALENQALELFEENEYPRALMLDSVGSVAVEGAADYVNYLICQSANRLGITAGRRLSPGYGRWHLREQRVLFTLLPAEEIGVGLSEQYMMIPRKSISFCVGIGRGLPSGSEVNPCQYCGMRACPYRRDISSSAKEENNLTRRGKKDVPKAMAGAK